MALIKSLKGEAIINDKVAFSHSFPRISWESLHLNRLKHGGSSSSGYHTIQTEGPHFAISIPSQTLIKNLQNNSECDVSINIEGENLGSIDDLSGYPAADLGPHTRHILSIFLKIQRQKECTLYSFSGETSLLDEKTVSSNTKTKIDELGVYKYKVWFIVPDDEINNVFNDANVVNNLIEYHNRTVFPNCGNG